MNRMLEIDLDKKCPQCGKKGATRVDKAEKWGLCLNCGLKNLEAKIKADRKKSKLDD